MRRARPTAVPIPLRKPHLRRTNIKHGNHAAEERDAQRPSLLDAGLRAKRAEGGTIHRGVGAGDEDILCGLLKDVAADLDAKRGHLGVAGGGEQGGALDLDQLGRGLEGAVEGLDQRGGQDVGRVAAVDDHGEAMRLAFARGVVGRAGGGGGLVCEALPGDEVVLGDDGVVCEFLVCTLLLVQIELLTFSDCGGLSKRRLLQYSP